MRGLGDQMPVQSRLSGAYGATVRTLLASGRYAILTIAALAAACGGPSNVGVSGTPPTDTAPAITVAPSGQSVLTGQTATFAVTAVGTAPLDYQWSKNGATIAGATASTYTTAPAALSDNGASFTVTGSHVVGSVTSPAATLTVTAAPAAPSIANQPQNQSVLAGATATFSVTAVGTAPLTYQWSRNGAAIPGGTAPTYTTPPTTLNDNGASFTVTVSNSLGSVASSAATLAVTASPAAPSITSQPVSQVVLAGATSTFSVTAVGTAPLSYQWSRNGAAIAGATASSYTTPATTTSDNGATFAVVVTNSVGSVTSASATLTVNSTPTLSAHPQTPTGTVGSPAIFAVTAAGAPTPAYQWSKNGAAIAGATASSYTTPATTASDNGAAFAVVVTNSVGSVTSASATLTVTNTGSAVSPQYVPLTVSQSQQFTATQPGGAGSVWSVDGVTNGNGTVGTINSNGLYAPGTQVGLHTIRATSSIDSTVSATATAAVSDIAGVYTFHNDLARSGQNLHEYALTPTFVSSGKFGKVWSCAVDGEIYAQPLYAANLSIGGANHNVVFVATEHDSVYAFDADSPACTTYWVIHLVSSTVTSIPSGDTGCGDIQGEIGITGTPVIDPASQTLYFVAATKEGGAWFQRLHRVSLSTGLEQSGSPVTVTATGVYNAFDPLKNNQRGALALANGYIYIGWSSHCDVTPYTGWIMNFDANSLTPTAAAPVTPNTAGGRGGIWMSGGAPASDSSGSVYLSTGNGSFAYTSNSPTPVPSGIDLSMSFIKFNSTSLAVQDFYSPANEATWSGQDMDISSSGVIVLPDGAGPSAHPDLLFGSDKQAHLWLLDRSSMGGFNTAVNPAVQQVPLSPASCGGTECVFSTPAYYQGVIYIGNSNGYIVALPLAGGILGVNAQTGYAASSSQSADFYGFPGPTPAISATPNGGAILWALDDSQNGTNGAATGPAVLHAYDATNLGTALYSSSTISTDAAGNAIKFVAPIIANGRVFVAASRQFTVYGPPLN